MPSVVDCLPEKASVLVVRLRSLGDCVLTTPALHLLKTYRPDLRINVMAEPAFQDVFRDNPDVHSLVAPTVWQAWQTQPQLAINLHGGTRSLWLTAASRAPVRAGFCHFRGQWLYNQSLPRAQDVLGVERTVHTAEHLASAMFHLGVPRTAIPRARLFAPWPATRQQPYAVLHPFASREDKRWPAERFLELAEALSRTGLQPVVVGTADDDWLPFRDLACERGSSLRGTISLLRGASLFVGNDSGPAHIAAALQIPAVVLFGPSDATVWAPWQAPQATALLEPRGMAHIPVERVWHAVEKVKVAV